MKVLFIDDRPHEILRQWHESGCGVEHEMLPLESFESTEQACRLVLLFEPDLVLVGHGLSRPGTSGSHVIKALRAQGYAGKIIANSGGGAKQFERDGTELDGSADRSPEKLRRILEALS